ncbi:uncharacterized protein LOC6542301 [Drosophila erecta]|uniref:Uncharacterized protein n=1 Tax=Drosophila erecta TaxID=7220 RepID=B3NAW4_DROER|nr:uncharacterized protein LOC6542301 [Drosophila erecta]EDV58678.2 uncharacterized protein Dere_GG10198 [Drosophila erecta]
MWNKPYMGIIIFCMMASGGRAIPTELTRYSQLGQGPLAPANNSVVSTTDHLGLLHESSSVAPDFEYALLGEDPQDQQWFRVSLTPKTNKTVYRAQFATRKHPPFNSEVAHRHDKTIQDLLNWLDRSEDQSLWKVYRDLLEYTPQAQSSSQEYPNGDKIEKAKKLSTKQECHRRNHRLLLVDDEGTSTTTSSPPSKSPMQPTHELVYFIKGPK